MNSFDLLGIAVGLAMDAFAVSIAAGLSIGNLTGRHIFRIAFHFGFFQAVMPVVGWLLGSTVSNYVLSWGNWISFILLAIIGGKMLLDGDGGEEKRETSDPSKGWMLVFLSVATSIDALAVGVGMAFMRVDILLPCVVIGLVAGGFSTVGICGANRIGSRWSAAANRFGGCVLILIGLRILCGY